MFGTIPDSIEKLTALETLYLNWNQLSGTIPTTIGNLKSIVYLHLGSNEFSGPIPQTIAKLNTMSYLNLGMNGLSGSIPNIANLTNLVVINLSNNSFGLNECITFPPSLLFCELDELSFDCKCSSIPYSCNQECYHTPEHPTYEKESRYIPLSAGLPAILIPSIMIIAIIISYLILTKKKARVLTEQM